RLAPRIERAFVLIAHVAGVVAAVLRDDRSERDELVGLRVEAWVVFETARQPDRAVAHPAIDERLHRLDLWCRRRSFVVAAHDELAHGAVADRGRVVDRRLDA